MAFRLDPAAAPADLERLVDAIGLPLARWDARQRLAYCNEPYLAWSGRDREALFGRTVAQLYGDTAWAAARNAFAAAYAGRQASYERRLTHQGASARWARVQVFPERDGDGRVVAVCTVAYDIHDDVLEREALEATRRRLDQFAANIPFPLTYVDRDYVLRFVNRAYTAAVGMEAAELIGRTIGAARGSKRWAEHKPHFDRALAGESSQYTRLAELSERGRRWVRTSYVPDRDDEGRIVGVYTVTVDIHDLTLAHQKLQRSAERDALTDTLSRRAMMERIDVATANASGSPMALFFVDLDGFKDVNDAYGHAAGDRLLVAVSQALQQAVRAEDAVGRFGGDEFLVLASVRDAAGAHTLALHLLDAVRHCAALAPGATPGPSVSASIGFALAPTDATQPLRLLQLADDAMYAAKRAGRNRAVHGLERG